MNKFIFLAFFALLLAGGCSQESVMDNKTETTDEAIKSAATRLQPDGIPGIAHIKISNALRQEFENISPNSLSGSNSLPASITLSNAPATLSATLKSIKATHIERLFPIDPRFEERKRREGLDRWYIVKFNEEQDLRSTIATLSANGQIELVEPAHYVAVPSAKGVVAETRAPLSTSEAPFNDPELGLQWHYNNEGTTDRFVEGADINLFEAWNTTTGTPNVIVSVVDGGIDVDHPDLIDNLWVNTEETVNGKDDDGNGFTDDVNGYNFVSRYGKITLDNAGHGTHVAGTVAARNNNGIGVGGVAGGDGTEESGVRLMSCQVFEDEYSSNDFAGAIVYGADNGAVISQNSWGYQNELDDIPSDIKEAVDYFIQYAGCDNDGNQLPDSPMKGGVVIFAAGNDDDDFLSYPAAYPPIVAVSAMAPDWKKAWYTNRGDWVDIMAPGGDHNYSGGQVYSTVPPELYAYNEYAYMQGTSMACPHVSGVAALIISELGGEGFTNQDLEQRLLNAFRPENINEHNPDFAGRLGLGYIDAALALTNNQNFRPEPVTDISATADFTEAVISWAAVTDEDDGAPVKYLLYCSETELTANNYKEVEPETISATGYSAGDSISHTVENLKENTEYHVCVIAVDRWGLESDFSLFTFSTPKNEPPVISGVPEDTIRVSGINEVKLTLNVSDPENQTISFKTEGEMRGVAVSQLRENGVINLTVRAVAPEGRHRFTVTASDELGASSSVTIPFEVFTYEPPTVTATIPDQLMGIGQSQEEIDLGNHISYQGTGELTVEAVSSDNGVATVATNGTGLSITGNKTGEAIITVSLSDGQETVQTEFRVRVVADTSAIVYHVYPTPATTTLNVLVNPEVTQAALTIRSVTGEKVLGRDVQVNGTNPVQLNIQQLSAGTYTLTLESDRGTYKKTFVKQ